MVVIRLARTGSKKNPFYHIVIADKRKPRDGRFIERLGYYNPMARGQDVRLQIEKERVDYWLGQGAKASERVTHLIKILEKTPDAAKAAGIKKGELKKAQAEASEKAQKKAEIAAKNAAEAEAKETKAVAAKKEAADKEAK